MQELVVIGSCGGQHQVTAVEYDPVEGLANKLGFDIKTLEGTNKILLLRNCVEPEVGEYILNCIIGE